MKRMLLIIFVFALALTSCSDEPKQPSVYDKTFVKEKVEVTFVLYKNEQEVTKAFNKHMSNSDQKVLAPSATRMGWAVWNNVDDTCVIHVVQPRLNESGVPKSKDDKVFKTWGHELAHCRYGSFHK